MTGRAVLFTLLLQSRCGRRPATHVYKDVLPILQAHCQGCHRPGEAAPMPLLTYPQTRPWAKAIKAAVLSRKMPPWFADPHYGKFTNDPSLDAASIGILKTWADTGAYEGRAADAPTPRVFAQGWSIPPPDAVIELPELVKVPASGTIDYRYYAVPTGWKEDRWVETIEVRPGDRSLVHHAIVYVQTADGSSGPQYLGGYAPGAVPQRWPAGDARLIRAGSTLVFQMHYTANGKPGLDRTRIGLVFAKQAPGREVIAMQALYPRLEIPPGADNYRVEAARTIPQDAYLLGMRAHMHLRGKSFEFRAVYPEGRSEVLLRIPKYDFNWQPYYYLQTPLKLPRGTRIECTAYFDNSANNAFNPDPGAVVRWGEQTWDEMMIGWFDIAAPATK